MTKNKVWSPNAWAVHEMPKGWTVIASARNLVPPYVVISKDKFTEMSR